MFNEQDETVKYLQHARNHVRKGFADGLREEHSAPPADEMAPGVPAQADGDMPAAEPDAMDPNEGAESESGEMVQIEVSPAELALIKKIRGKSAEKDMPPDESEMAALSAEG